ncbi:MAG: phosphoribosylamine--glycine ligase [bacterium]
MKVLVIGSGGREHAIVWKLKQTSKVKQIYCVPGNGGISKLARCESINISDHEEIINFVKKEKIDLTVVGPEQPLVEGIVNSFRNNNLPIFGPEKKASLLEGDKAWAKGFCNRNNIPTANYRVTDSFEEALQIIKEFPMPLVIKASGLAAGKGVIICEDAREAKVALQKMMIEKAFGGASDRIVIEEFLTGEELTVMAFCDSKTILPLVPTQDHKKLYEDDKGPNTGGMGAYGPPLCFNREVAARIESTIFNPFLAGLDKDAIRYNGIIYFGLILTKECPKILEFNVRFGDPEAQVVLPLLKFDLVDLIEAAMSGKLSKYKGKVSCETQQAGCCVVAASGGYPGDYEKNKYIEGLEEASAMPDTVVFHSGTVLRGDKMFTSGGRVLGITSWGNYIKEAIDKSYGAVSKIRFDKMHFRKDIGWRSLKKSNM